MILGFLLQVLFSLQNHCKLPSGVLRMLPFGLLFPPSSTSSSAVVAVRARFDTWLSVCRVASGVWVSLPTPFPIYVSLWMNWIV